MTYPYLFEIVHNGNTIFEDQSQREYGFIGAATAFGSAVGYLIFGRYEKQIGRPRGVFIGSFFLGLYCVFFYFLPSFQFLLMFGIVFGIANGMTGLAVNAIFAETVPNEIRGRAYSATNAYLQTFSMITISLSGFIADNIGIVLTITLTGVFAVLAVLLFSFVTHFFRFLIPKPIAEEVSIN